MRSRHRPILAGNADGKRAVGSLRLGKRIVERLRANRFSKRSNCDAWTVILVRKMHANHAASVWANKLRQRLRGVLV